MPSIVIKYFASVRETLGTASESLHTSSTTVGDLRDELTTRGGAYAQVLARGQSVRIALNHTMTEESAALTEGCEVAFFPPVTGG